MAGLKFVTGEWFSYTREPKSQHIKITRYVMVACIQAGMASTSVCKKNLLTHFVPAWFDSVPQKHTVRTLRPSNPWDVFGLKDANERVAHGSDEWGVTSVRLESAVCRCPTYIHLYITAINLGFFPVIHCETLVSLRPPEAFVLVSPPEKSFRNCY